jgi:hypothetical protein
MTWGKYKQTTWPVCELKTDTAATHGQGKINLRPRRELDRRPKEMKREQPARSQRETETQWEKELGPLETRGREKSWALNKTETSVAKELIPKGQNLAGDLCARSSRAETTEMWGEDWRTWRTENPATQNSARELKQKNRINRPSDLNRESHKCTGKWIAQKYATLMSDKNWFFYWETTRVQLIYRGHRPPSLIFFKTKIESCSCHTSTLKLRKWKWEVTREPKPRNRRGDFEPKITKSELPVLRPKPKNPPPPWFWGSTKKPSTGFEGKPRETVATSFEAKLEKTVATGFEAKPAKIVRVVL